MPYLESTVKKALDNGLIEPSEPGHLNYLFTRLCNNYIELKGNRYQYFNDVIGALESCKLEYYRRAVAVYENEKIASNGDVF